MVKSIDDALVINSNRRDGPAWGGFKRHLRRRVLRCFRQSPDDDDVASM